MASGRGLPFVPVEIADVEEDLRDLLLGRSVTIPINRLQHLAQTHALLPSQACVGRNGTAMQSRQEAFYGLYSVEAVQSERNDCDLGRSILDAVDDLKPLTVSEIVPECRLLPLMRRWIGASDDARAAGQVLELCRGFAQDDDACIILWKPQDRSVRRWRPWIDGEIANPSDAECGRSGS